jgi:putative intracellular protease/amidase
MTKQTIGAVIFPGFEMLDYYGPLEIFCVHNDVFEIRAVGELTGSGSCFFRSCNCSR